MKTVIELAIIPTCLGSIFGPPAARASGDAPWCAITEVGDGDGQWDCQYETVQECVPNVLAGNRGHCSPNPYYSPPPATASVPSKDPARLSTANPRKMQNNGHRDQICGCRRLDVRRFRGSCV
jgi:hypothetical protein